MKFDEEFFENKIFPNSSYKKICLAAADWQGTPGRLPDLPDQKPKKYVPKNSARQDDEKAPKSFWVAQKTKKLRAFEV